MRQYCLVLLVLALIGCDVSTLVPEPPATVDSPFQSAADPHQREDHPGEVDVAPEVEAAADVETPAPIELAPVADVGPTEPVSLTICSFNIQFLGNSRARDDEALALIVADYDIVLVQELVSPPFMGTFPDGTAFKPDPESAEFFEAMTGLGFDYIISEEDTGTGDTIHRNGSSTEWWVAFYKPESVEPATDLPSGFLAADRSNHDDFERVPYAFGFRTLDHRMDFVLISVHLQPGGSSKSKARRKQELDAIARWIDSHDDIEQDFVILGDMHIEDAGELSNATPTGFLSLNDECRATNTNVNGPKPYDHVMFNVTHSIEIDRSFDMRVVDLVSAVRGSWTAKEPYPGDPYNHNEFRKYYSDHHPVVFRMRAGNRDDDGLPPAVAKQPAAAVR